MTITIKDLTVKNFMSVGNVTQAVDFTRENLTLVLGENLDQGGDDAGSRNGTGKTLGFISTINNSKIKKQTKAKVIVGKHKKLLMIY
jgi:hypothetical protein